MMWTRLVGLAAVLMLAGACAVAQEVAPDPALGESIEFVRSNRVFQVMLETTIFKPQGAGPFPVVVINHGKDSGNNRLQPRARYLPAVREFLQRGYAVVVPMREGFSKSGGSAVGEGCNIAGNGEAQADDVRAVVSWLIRQPWADATRMVMMGQSHGGLTTLAYAQSPDPGFKLFVNFAGGLKFTAGCQWELALQDAYAAYGAKTRVPSLWFYGANDGYFPPPVIRPAFDAYVAAGGKAELVAYGPFGVDAHHMFGAYAGLPIWWKRVEDKLSAAGLPTAVVQPQFARGHRPDQPPASGYAALDDAGRVPHLSEGGREAYRGFLLKPAPRAFALAPGGVFGWASGGDDPMGRALANCNRRNQIACRLYAVDNDVVWKNE
ncbi:dienelactone hydrolase family protein [Variovorax terrae]|uniref:Prolyl oligopeptidase family serine peptidase n=1 Tax=Variovorax terrae TaxID=2923278 RepID=A0A9X1VTH2_9BURK|nr:CocE/NonD family hydrolase [Variovorax terrae]MCJ0761744.1 prolyl oligopeptidase family serine peptidase [Variovorax terrae]